MKAPHVPTHRKPFLRRVRDFLGSATLKPGIALAASQKVLLKAAHHLCPYRRITRKNVIHNDTHATNVNQLYDTLGIWLIVHDCAT
jgi:hypothetical protein